MRWNDLYVAGTGLCLPEPVAVDSAVAQGLYDHDEANRAGYRSVTVMPADQGTPELAAAAGRAALADSGHQPGDIGVLCHAVALHAGIDAWNSAAYVQRELDIDGECLMAEVRSGCNGLAALELACAFMQTHGLDAGLVTAADSWPQPGFDRWRAEPGILYADGASSWVVSRKHGFARVVVMKSLTQPTTEALHRGNDPFGPFRSGADFPIQLYRRSREFRASLPNGHVARLHRQVFLDTVDAVIAEGGVQRSDVRHIVLPNLGAELMDDRREWLDLPNLDSTTWEFGRGVGHIGVADGFAGVHHLRETGQLQPGDLTLIIGEGGGYVATVVLLESVE